jgi:anti-sigma factor RsiW
MDQDLNLGCETFEAMCLDAVDGTLTPAEQAVFDRHIASCTSCAGQFAEAQRGAAWMDVLKTHQPEPPSGMLQRIIARTSESEMARVFPRFGEVPTPSFNVVPVLGKRERVSNWFEATFFNPSVGSFQPRMAMTAAMAFFSLALTMNLSGVHFADLRPNAIHRSVSDAQASAARQIQSLRVVNQLESRVNELRDDDAGTPASAVKAKHAGRKNEQEPNSDQDKKDSKKPEGTSEVVAPISDAQGMQGGE